MRSLIRGYPLVLLLAVLLTTACAATKRNTAMQSSELQQDQQDVKSEVQAAAMLADRQSSSAQTQADSTRVIRVYAEAVPAASATVTIPIQNLLDLPTGAKYDAQDGRASVEVERQGDRIVASGRCDSIARRCAYFEDMVFRQRSLIDSLRHAHYLAEQEALTRSMAATARSGTVEQVEIAKKPPSTWYWWLFTGFVAGMACAAWLTRTNPLKKIVELIKRLV